MKKTLLTLLSTAACAAPLGALAEDAKGLWSGMLGDTTKVVVQIDRTADGQWQATMTIPQQGSTIKADTVASTADQLSFSIARVKASYQANWDQQAQAWVGTWTQGGPAKLSLKRTDAHAVAANKPKRPQVDAIAAAPAPYASTEITFANAAAGVTLAGTLTTPKGKGPFPAVVLVHGSGRIGRDQDAYGHKQFLVLADHLTRLGVAVLRYDKRGVDKSGGDYKSAVTADFASDAEAALAFLRSRSDIDHAKIGLIGHSEGGLIAPMVAARDPKLGFVVMMAGPGVRGDLLLVEQLASTAKARGGSDAEIAQERQMNQTVFAAMVAEKDHATAVQKAKGLMEQAERDGKVPAGSAAQFLRRSSSPWFHAFLALEPAPHLRKMHQAVLVLNGELDLQVSAKRNLDAIGAALANNPRAVIRQLPKLNHLFQTDATGGKEYGAIEETLAPIALSTISDWILGTVK